MCKLIKVKHKIMRYTKKRVLIIVFVIWCILFFVFLCTPILKPFEINNPIVIEIIGCCIMPSALIALFVGSLFDVVIWDVGGPYVLIIVLGIIYISPPFFYMGIAYLIMRRMERNSLKNNGDIITLFGSNDKP